MAAKIFEEKGQERIILSNSKGNFQGAIESLKEGKMLFYTVTVRRERRLHIYFFHNGEFFESITRFTEIAPFQKISLLDENEELSPKGEEIAYLFTQSPKFMKEILVGKEYVIEYYYRERIYGKKIFWLQENVDETISFKAEDETKYFEDDDHSDADGGHPYNTFCMRLHFLVSGEQAFTKIYELENAPCK